LFRGVLRLRRLCSGQPQPQLPRYVKMPKMPRSWSTNRALRCVKRFS
jgi:hypothetical protein